jgi:hypothetical protein
MAAVFGGITQADVVANAQAKLRTYRIAQESVEAFYQWLSAYSSADLQGPPLNFSQADADALLSAFADAHEEYVLHHGGGLGTYTIPYNFSASQNKVVGP